MLRVNGKNYSEIKLRGVIVALPNYYAKERNKTKNMENVCDLWTWKAIDVDSKLVVSWLVAARDYDTATCFINDVATSLKNRVQLTTDGLQAYLDAIPDSFGSHIDFGPTSKNI